MVQPVQTYSVKVFRSNPGVNPKVWYDTFTINYEPGVSVLGVLNFIYETIDPSLAYYHSCRVGKCTGCHVRINGKTRLACTTVADGSDLLIEPMPGYTVVRDIIVDRQSHEKSFCSEE